jgi:hypothetical protein
VLVIAALDLASQRATSCSRPTSMWRHHVSKSTSSRSRFAITAGSTVSALTTGALHTPVEHFSCT